MKVGLTAEGTYPHQFGGVSVWCDQLVRGMPDCQFQLVALVASGSEPVRWSLPRNVASLATIPLWGPQPPVPWRARLRRGCSGAPIRELIDVLLAPPGQAPARFADVLRMMFTYAQSQNLSAALASDYAVRVLSEAWRKRWPPDSPAGRNGHAGEAPGALAMHNGHGPAGPAWAAPTLQDAVTAMQLIEHALRPLSHPPLEADLVHVVTNGLGALPALAAKWQHGMPMLVSEHGVYIREQYMHLRHPPFSWPVKELFLRLLRLICTLGYQEADLIAPGNVYNKRWEEQLGADPARLRTVYNGVDPAEFPMLYDEPEAPTISWVGRIDPVKDLETLLLAFSIVLKQMPEARLRMFGSAARGREKYLERCQALAADLGISEQATFEGRVRRVRDAYQAGHVVVLCSITEGFPYSLIEAMTCGRACVGTDVGGVGEALAGTGIVVPPRNPAVLAQACLRLLRDESLRRDLGAAARQRALEFFTVDRTVSTFDEIYKSLGSGQRAPVTGAGQVPAGSVSAVGPWGAAGLWPAEDRSWALDGQEETELMLRPWGGSGSWAVHSLADTELVPQPVNRPPAGNGPDEATARPEHAGDRPEHAGDRAEDAGDRTEDLKLLGLQPPGPAG
jgi:glycosyltransferase involved in cell wall biosynthesis